MDKLYVKTSNECSKLITNRYSTSFSMGIRLFHKEFRMPIYSIYGFVRFADEIVDSFHEKDKKYLLEKFRTDTFEAIDMGISLNPVLQSFQEVVNEFAIENDLIDAFLDSMEMDLEKTDYVQEKYDQYIYGSADVVGLMCLQVFVQGDKTKFENLKEAAMSLGSAFQKVNFLRDLKEDYEGLSRTYFPNTNLDALDETSKAQIIADIESDFKKGYQGILQLPPEAKFGVFMAYRYYRRLLKKLSKTAASDIKSTRIRVPNYEKFGLLTRSYVKYQLKLVK